jgi:hypothetical protein
MQPSPMVEMVGPVVPSLRFSMNGSPHCRWRCRRDDEADMNLLRESDKLDNSKWLVQYVEQ